jgi:hypothetical protein
MRRLPGWRWLEIALEANLTANLTMMGEPVGHWPIFYFRSLISGDE